MCAIMNSLSEESEEGHLLKVWVWSELFVFLGKSEWSM